MPNYDEIIDTALEGFDLAGLRILDAGSGRMSARALIDRKPKHLTCICAPQDRFKIDSTFNELGGERVDARVMGADLSESNLFQSASFDFILADHLVSEIDIFAPGKHVVVLASLFDYLESGGNIVVIDIEPDRPPPLDPAFAPHQKVLEIDLTAMELAEMDNLTRYRQYINARKFLHELALNRGIPGFRQIPGDWVEKWMIGVGFTNVTPQLASMIIEVEVDQEFEERSRSLMNLVKDDKLRKYLEALLDRTEGLLHEAAPFDIEQDVYIISAGKD